MQYRRLGKTNLNVSAIGFGCIKLPEVDEKQASDALNRALDLGVTFFDTARNYKDSEAKIGKALKGKRDKYYLATKSSKRDAESLTQDLETSLRELQTDKIDLYQLHTVSDEATYKKVMGPSGALEAARKAKEVGKIDHIGITIHRDLNVMRSAIESGEFETIMLAYSPLDQENVASEIMPLAKKHDLGVIIMKSLSGGLLVTPESEVPAGAPNPVVFGSLRFVLNNDIVSVVIPGMRSVKEVEENVPVGNMVTAMTDEEKQELTRLIGELKTEFRYGQVCLRCEYCQPCPQGIRIPDLFRAADMFRGYQEELKHLGKELFDALEVKPDKCEVCRQCEENCPAGLKIPEKLKEVADLFAE